MKEWIYKGALVVFTVVLNQSVFAQQTLVTWPLTSSFNTVNYNINDLDNAIYSRGTGINEWAISYYNLGGDWYDFSTNASTDVNDYVQFEISPKTGVNAKNIYITSLELEMEQFPWQGFPGPANYQIDYSKTPDFSVAFTASAGTVGSSFAVNDIQFLSPLEVYSGETLYFRIYAYNSDIGDLIIKKSDFTIKGYIEPLTNVTPVPALSFQQECATNGNLLFNLPAGFNPANQTILIFAKAASPITFGSSTALLSSYPNANSDLAVFNGSAYQNDVNAKLVYRGTSAGPIQLTNLSPGVIYYFVAFNFLNNGGIGNISGETYADGSASGAIPDVTSFNNVASSTRINLDFSAPNCVEAVMIVAKEGVINGVPSGDGSTYIPDPDFLGTGTAFDGGKVVYNTALSSGQAGSLSVTSLTDGTTYNFKAFVRMGSSWSNGIEITATPDISSIIITQIQSRGADFFEFMTLTRMDISNLNLTDQGVCESGAIYRSFGEWEAENFFNSNGNPDVTVPLTDIPAGTFVKVYSGAQTVDLDYSDGLIVLQNSQLNFDQNGDQALVYTNPIPGPFQDCGATPNPISAAIDFASSTGWITSGTPNDNTSYKPNTPAAFETLHTKPNGRFNKGNPKGDSTLIFASIMTPANWRYQNLNDDFWKLKRIQFQKSDYLEGIVAFNSVTGSSFNIDLSDLKFELSSNSTRYMVVMAEGATIDRPINRYTCYQPNNDFSLAPDVVKSKTGSFPITNPCWGTEVFGIGKIVYFNFGLPSNLAISGLKCDSEYTIKIYAINGNGVTMARGKSKKATIMTTQDAGVQDVFYSRNDGNVSDPIWAKSPTGAPRVLPPLTPCNKLVIQSVNSVMLDVDVSVGEVEIEAGGRLVLNSKTLSLQKDFIINGTINSANDKVIFNGTAGEQQLITTTEISFYDVEIDKNSSLNSNLLSIFGNIAIRHHISILAGDLEIKPGVSLRLVSNSADYAAALTEVPDASKLRGNFIIERFFPSITTDAGGGSGNYGTGWRYLAVPLSKADFNQISDNFHTGGYLGSEYQNWLVDGYYFPSIKKYNEAVPGVQDMGFDSDHYTTLGSSNVLLTAPNIRFRRNASVPADINIDPGEGVLVYLSSLDYPSLQQITLDAVGEPYVGDLTVPLSYTPSAAGANEDGWQLIANPYPSAIDWKSVKRTAGVSNFVYLYDTEGAGNFITLDANASQPQLIASSNAFWVKVNQNSSITFKERHKSPDVNAPFYKSADDGLEEMVIKITNSTDSLLTDYTKIRLIDGASRIYDIDFDAYKLYSLNNQVPGLSTGIDSLDFAINSFGHLDTLVSIPLKAKIGVAGTYRFSFDLSGTEFQSVCLILWDKLTGEQALVTDGSIYEFNSEINSDQDSTRFALVFAPILNLQSYDATCYGGSNGEVDVEIFNTSPVDYELFDAAGGLAASGQGQNEFTIEGLSQGFYQLEVSGFDGVCSMVNREVFIGQSAPLPEPGIVAYDALCNNGNDGEISVDWEDSSFYQLSLFKGSDLLTVIPDASVEYSFQNLEQGSYRLNISNTCDTIGYNFNISHIDSLNLDFNVPADTISLQEGGHVFYQNTSENAYDFRWGFSPDQEAPISAENGEFTYTIPGNYEIILSGRSAEGCRDFKVKHIVVEDVTTSIAVNRDRNENFTIIYMQDKINLNYRLPKSQTLQISIYDGLGKMINNDSYRAQTSGEYQILTSGLSHGIYFLHINRPDKETLMLRFVKRD